MRPQMLLMTLFFATGLLLCALAIPLIREQIPRNPWYGFRVPKTLASDEVWYPANRHMGGWLLLCGVITVTGVLALWPFAGRLAVDAVGWWGLALTVIPLMAAVYKGFRFLEKL